MLAKGSIEILESCNIDIPEFKQLWWCMVNHEQRYNHQIIWKLLHFLQELFPKIFEVPYLQTSSPIKSWPLRVWIVGAEKEMKGLLSR